MKHAVGLVRPFGCGLHRPPDAAEEGRRWRRSRCLKSCMIRCLKCVVYDDTPRQGYGEAVLRQGLPSARERCKKSRLSSRCAAGEWIARSPWTGASRAGWADGAPRAAPPSTAAAVTRGMTGAPKAAPDSRCCLALAAAVRGEQATIDRQWATSFCMIHIREFQRARLHCRRQATASSFSITGYLGQRLLRAAVILHILNG
jgi:hypothetical protein